MSLSHLWLLTWVAPGRLQTTLQPVPLQQMAIYVSCPGGTWGPKVQGPTYSCRTPGASKICLPHHHCLTMKENIQKLCQHIQPERRILLMCLSPNHHTSEDNEMTCPRSNSLFLAAIRLEWGGWKFLFNHKLRTVTVRLLSLSFSMCC